MPTPLAARHMAAEKRLREFVVTQLRGAWDRLPAYNEGNLDQWLSSAVPIVTAAQRQSVSVTDAYLARALRRRPIGLDVPGLIGPGVRNGTPPEEVYRRPFVRIWTALADGKPYADAVRAGLAQATGSGAMDVQLSMRATADAIDRADDGFFGYTRTADAGACEFCQEVDGAYVKASEGFAMALHNHCGCGLEPNDEPHRGAVLLPDGTPVREFQYGPLNANVAVENHGELGPVLVSPVQHFTEL